MHAVDGRWMMLVNMVGEYGRCIKLVAREVSVMSYDESIYSNGRWMSIRVSQFALRDVLPLMC